MPKLLKADGSALLLNSGGFFLLNAFVASFIQEDWSSGLISESKWIPWGGDNVTVENEQLKITSELVPEYIGIEALGYFDLTDSYVFNQVTYLGNTGIESYEVYPLYVVSSVDTTDQLFIYIDSFNSVHACVEVDGEVTTVGTLRFNQEENSYYRIREASGAVYFDYSADAVTWINFASVSTPFSLDDVTLGFMIGTWANELATTYTLFDNFNIDGVIVPPTTGYILDGRQLKRPVDFERSFIDQKVDFMSINGKTSRDRTSRKEKFILSYTNLTRSQVELLLSIIAQNTAVQFVVNENSMITIDTLCFPFIGAIVYDKVGDDHRASLQLELIEEE
jgi:hypothetical protein